MLSLDTIFHVVEGLGIVAMLWRVNRSINRYIDLFKDFPPHRHIDGRILYPKDFSPGVTNGGKA